MDYTTPIKQIRVLIADTATPHLLDDQELQTYLELNDWSEGYKPGVFYAAADALDAIATSEVLTSKVIRTQDLSTDGAKVADALRKQATGLRDRADEEVAKSESFFQVIPFTPGCTTEGEEQPGWW